MQFVIVLILKFIIEIIIAQRILYGFVSFTILKHIKNYAGNKRLPNNAHYFKLFGLSSIDTSLKTQTT